MHADILGNFRYFYNLKACTWTGLLKKKKKIQLSQTLLSSLEIKDFLLDWFLQSQWLFCLFFPLLCQHGLLRHTTKDSYSNAVLSKAWSPIPGCESLSDRGRAPFRFNTIPVCKPQQRLRESGSLSPLLWALCPFNDVFDFIFSAHNPPSTDLTAAVPGLGLRADATAAKRGPQFSGHTVARWLCCRLAARSDVLLWLNILFMLMTLTDCENNLINSLINLPISSLQCSSTVCGSLSIEGVWTKMKLPKIINQVTSCIQIWGQGFNLALFFLLFLFL